MSRTPDATTDTVVARRATRGVFEARKRGPQKWVYIGEWPTDDFTTPDSPPWENGWAHAGAPYDRVAFRWDEHGRIEFKGHADSAGAVTDTVAFTLPEEYWPDYDQSYLTDIYDSGLAAFQVARVLIESTTGTVTISWPAS